MIIDEQDSLTHLFHRPELNAQPVEFSSGQMVERPGLTLPRNVYLILEGQVRLSQSGPDNQTRLVEILGPGDWFGASALGDCGRRCMEAVAAVDTRLLAAPADRLLELLPHHPQAVAMLIQQLVIKLRTARQDAARLVFDDCNRRLIKTLLRFSETAAASPSDHGVVLRITHQQLAQAVGVARETISVALTHLRRKHLLRTGRNQLSFDPQVLQRLLNKPSTPANPHNPAHRAQCA